MFREGASSFILLHPSLTQRRNLLAVYVLHKHVVRSISPTYGALKIVPLGKLLCLVSLLSLLANKCHINMAILECISEVVLK